MKKLILLAACAVIAAAALTSCAGKSEAADKSLQKVLDKKAFVLGLDDSFPPMGFRNENNEIVGYDVDLAREATKRMGVELVLQPIDWNAKEQELNTGKIDCIWNGFTITPQRAEALTFSKPYLKNAQVVVVRGDSSFNTLADLAGKTVGLQAGSSAADALEASVEFKASLKGVVEFKENLTALMDLEVKGVDAVIMDLMVANDNINRSGKSYRILEEGLSPEEYGIGFRKADLALMNKVQSVLEEMAADGTIARIATQWFGADISIVGK
ncbi:amino acid ABC transporter substrate-binding protein [Treponema zuelzerae]|uniref:Amino acid ABC transporter substrate-binding protein n=1 Tax=Teretinema zuelzerae TaxID=156 RepID=A0AAE3EH57_9SPIR|nr:amino acid ABC transporter substrate-binding protein [Teretinema zuelzerae]MBN2812310.1 amino acid ABC transporter substrate-binding protein [Spirochaetales bacterium]MCD1653434.1 amino acid ABC transporter substrate-binding protein [Teretinema zuelzerae]HPO02950.1 amino acid ABC transporter substrate-binding protein [Treponemataceae bacterium]